LKAIENGFWVLRGGDKSRGVKERRRFERNKEMKCGV
jgi:hypothetical protein